MSLTVDFTTLPDGNTLSGPFQDPQTGGPYFTDPIQNYGVSGGQGRAGTHPPIQANVCGIGIGAITDNTLTDTVNFTMASTINADAPTIVACVTFSDSTDGNNNARYVEIQVIPLVSGLCSVYPFGHNGTNGGYNIGSEIDTPALSATGNHTAAIVMTSTGFSVTVDSVVALANYTYTPTDLANIGTWTPTTALGLDFQIKARTGVFVSYPTLLSLTSSNSGPNPPATVRRGDFPYIPLGIL